MFKIYQEKRFESAQRPGEYLNYLYYAPQNADAPLPLIVYIHGAGSRGSSLSQMGVAGPIKEIEEGRGQPRKQPEPDGRRRAD